MPANIISGRVVLKESGIGIPDLLVVIYDVDPGTQPEEAGAAPESHEEGERQELPPKDGLGDRIDSRLTDRDGAFHFSFEAEEFRTRDGTERRPDLQLAVIAPEEPAAAPQMLYASADIRQDAGRSEEYLIRLSSDALTRAGVRIPTDPNPRAE